MIKQIFKNNSYQLVECQRDNRTLEILIKQKLYASMCPSYAYCVRMTAQIHLGCSWDFPWGRSLEEGRTTCWVRRGCPEDFKDSLFALSEQFKPSNRREWILKNYSTILPSQFNYCTLPVTPFKGCTKLKWIFKLSKW